MANSESPKVLLFGRHNCEGTKAALEHLNTMNFQVTYVESKGRGEKIPEDIYMWQGDYIFCFRSLFILPEKLLNKATVAAINFHPAPVEYPGSGCANYALYDNAEHYGVTAHMMNRAVDNGSIIECRRFPIFPMDSVDSLVHRTHHKLLDLFYDTTTAIYFKGKDYITEMLTQSSHEKWRGFAKKIAELDKLQNIDLSVSEDDLKKIIRATYTQNFPPRLFLHGYEFVLKAPQKRMT